MKHINQFFNKHYIFILALVLFGPAQANTVNFSGDTSGQPTWHRTIDDCGALSFVGTAVNYQTQFFTVSSNDSCNLAMNSNTFDTYLHLYAAPFDPTNQANNCIASKDGGGPILNSLIPNQPLVAGQTYVYVASGWSNGDAGAFDASISCPNATVRLLQPPTKDIPTLSSWTLFLLVLTLGLSGLFFRRYKH